MQNSLYGKDLISINDLDLKQIELILERTAQLKTKPVTDVLQNKIIASCFFEPSTRTRLSFESATLRLGGKVIGFSEVENTSAMKGESLQDAMQVIANYADLIVLRHPRAGAARLATDAAEVPVINAGDAANQHPTQALLDLFTIKECQGKIDGLSIALVGDLKYGRTVHSLLQALALYKVRLFLVAPEALSPPAQFTDALKKSGIRFSFHATLDEIMPKLDIVYMTRIQQERFNLLEFQSIKSDYGLSTAMLRKAKTNLKILHPLPRLQEIPCAIDATPFAHYFAQAANGVWLRQALLSLVLHK